MTFHYTPRQATHNDELPPPPKAFYHLIAQANERGYWLHKCRYRYHAQQDGGRFKITKAHSRDALVVSDDIDVIRQWLLAQAPGGAS